MPWLQYRLETSADLAPRCEEALLALGAAAVTLEDNAERNGIGEEQLHIHHPGQLAGGEKADVVIANILAGPLCDLAAILCTHLKPGGALILSGILTEQVAMIRSHYAMPLEIAAESEGWVALRGQAP